MKSLSKRSKLPIDVSNMPSMDELLGCSGDPASGPKPVAVRRARKRGRRTLSLTAPELPVDTSDMSSMAEMLESQSGERKKQDRRDATIQRQTKRNHLSSAARTAVSVATDNMPNMEKLLQQGTASTEAKKLVAATVISKSGTGIEVRTENEITAFIPNREFAGWHTLHPGDELQVMVDYDHSRSQKKPITLAIDRRCKPGKPRHTHTPSRRIVTNYIGIRFIIDGSNICRSYRNLNGISSLLPLLTITSIILKRHGCFFCLFDASERYCLRKNLREPGADKCYQSLLREASAHFQEAPAATDADDLILQAADRDGLSIISNDNFSKLNEKHHQLYPWLTTSSKRLIKGIVEDNRLIVEDLTIDEPLVRDVSLATCNLVRCLRGATKGRVRNNLLIRRSNR